jgi:lipopolysaccharide/colanic/teichoic acid biosynthesis glycosyltransferase
VATKLLQFDFLESSTVFQHLLKAANRLRGCVKRGGDIICSFVGMVLLSPLFLFIALRIKSDTPGPVIFDGDRVGYKGKVFKIHKFRSMYHESENGSNAPITQNHDERITPFGKFLRDTKLNELPQLWNVFVGEMSLVGPRPEHPHFVKDWPEDVRQKILSMRPGITSPASIIYCNEEELLNGDGYLEDYVETILPNKLELDQKYVENHSIYNDLVILVKTVAVLVPKLFKRKA